MCRFEDVQMCRCADLQICGCADWWMCGSVILLHIFYLMQVCVRIMWCLIQLFIWLIEIIK